MLKQNTSEWQLYGLQWSLCRGKKLIFIRAATTKPNDLAGQIFNVKKYTTISALPPIDEFLEQ